MSNSFRLPKVRTREFLTLSVFAMCMMFGFYQRYVICNTRVDLFYKKISRERVRSLDDSENLMRMYKDDELREDWVYNIKV